MNAFRAVVVACLLSAPSLLAADDPFAAVGQLLMSGRGAEARAAIVKVRDAAVAKSDASGEAVSWLLLGLADVSAHDTSAARAELQKAGEKLTAIHDHFAAWLSLWVLAELEKQEGQSDRSLEIHEKMLALLRDAADPQSHFSIESLKALALTFGAPPEQLGPVMQSPDIVKPFMLRFAEIISRDAYGSALLEAGLTGKAEEQLTQAGAAAAMFGDTFTPQLSLHMGDLRRQQWRIEEARASYQKALDNLKSMPALWQRDNWLELDIVGKLAELDVSAGRIDDALAWNDRALGLARASENKKRETAVLRARADLLQKVDRRDDALKIYGDALRSAVERGDRSAEASIYSDLGALHMFEGAYGTAARELEKSIEIYQAINEPMLESTVWTLLAEVHLLLEAHDAAGHDLEAARALAKKSNFKLADAMIDFIAAERKLVTGAATPDDLHAAMDAWWQVPETRSLLMDPAMQRLLYESVGGTKSTPLDAEKLGVSPLLRSMALMLEGKILLERRDYTGARTAWRQALAANPNRDHKAGLLALIGASYFYERKVPEAIDYFQQSAKALDLTASDVKVEELLSGYLGSGRRYYFDILIEMLVQQGRGLEAFAQAERARSRAFLQLVGNHRFNPERGADPRLVREAEIVRTSIAELDRSSAAAKGNEAARLAAELTSARQRYSDVLTRVKVSSPEYAALTNVVPLPIETVRADLPQDTTLISYFVSAHQVHAWVLDRTSAAYVLLPLDPAGLQRIVCWAEAFGTPVGPRGIENSEIRCQSASAGEAFDKLIAPLADHIHGSRLVLVPHGVLHYVPFAALHNAATSHYLIEDYTLTYAPSASALKFIRASESPVFGRALVLGDPVTAPPLLPKLPGAAAEATAVAETLGTTAHVGADARESLLYSQGHQVDLIHLAAHGVYDSASPLFSRIALAAGDGQDGNLTVHETLSSLDLSGVNLVVLSACRSAAGARSGGDEIVGLTRSLLYAGTPGVISTLWNIDDAASAGLMKVFYTRLVAGASVADALRQAQLEVLHGEHGDPRYWAAFMLSGDPQGRWKSAARGEAK